MFKITVVLISLGLQSCAAYFYKAADDNAGYFADATGCFQSSVRKESVKVPTAGTMTVIDLPIGNDANIFGLCMEQAGHPAPQANPNDYLDVARYCLQQARSSSEPDDTYARCVRLGKITVETIPAGRSK
ncbi:MAG: hypothetical protein Q7U57_00890 [Methylovulum sp.]|nr:hypothetical protein [Methylovulum sp.]